MNEHNDGFDRMFIILAFVVAIMLIIGAARGVIG